MTISLAFIFETFSRNHSLIPTIYKDLIEAPNENFLGCSISDEQILAQNLQMGLSNDSNVDKVIKQIFTNDKFCLSQSMRSYKLSSNPENVRMILHGSKEGIIYIYEVHSKLENPNYEVKKVGQYNCVSNLSPEIVSCAFIESKKNFLDSSLGQFPAAYHNHHVTEHSESNLLDEMKLLGHVVAANKRGEICLLKILNSY